MGGECGGQPGVGLVINFRTALLGPKDGVSERLGGPVCLLAGAKRLQACFPFIERALCRLASAVELFLQLVQ